jgi:hypothetical protein
MLWSTLKAQARRILKDADSTSYRWSDDEMLDYVAWSLDALCSHTCIATATSFTLDGTTTDFTLPDDVYEPIDRSGVVYADNGVPPKVYLNPVRFNYITQAFAGYTLTGVGNSTLRLINPLYLSGSLVVEYFAMYPHPTEDSDNLLTPSWANAALVYRISAYAISRDASRRPEISQWNTKKDSGKPTDNPLQEQVDAFMSMWEHELSLYPPQQRENYFRKS